MKNQLLIILTLGLVFPAFALETDNYLTWKHELKDSSSSINAFIADEIQIAIEKSNAKRKPQDCQDVTSTIALRFMSYFVDKNPLENWLKENLKDDEIYPRTGDYFKESIYRDPFRFYVPAFGLSPNVQVNGIYLGTDKLTHFSSTGRRYFNHYLKELDSGLNDEEARKSAIRFGLKNETSLLGYWSSGVFSYGDIEANYQGLLFYKKLCFDKTNSYLSQNSQGKWKLKLIPDIRDYVNPFMDETYNLSYRLPENWEKVARVLKQEYCSLADSPEVATRMNYYRQFSHRSFSLDYVRELQSTGHEDAPIPDAIQSFTELCRSRN